MANPGLRSAPRAGARFFRLGATWVERHFTLDRSWKGTDHAASLEPDGLRRLTRDIRNVHKALRPRPAELLDVEVPTRAKLKYLRPS
jgi:N-acetylneuraminate synthase